ncbi:hypothetical protein LguiB_009201 [Lonicera macranthoides]
MKWRVDKIEEVKLLCPLVAELGEPRKRVADKKREVALVKEELAKVEAELDELNSLCGEKAAEVKVAYGDMVERMDTTHLGMDIILLILLCFYVNFRD